MEQNLLLPWPGAFGWDLLRESSCCPVRQPLPHHVCCYATNKKQLEQWKRRKRRDLGETEEIPNHLHYSKLGNNLYMNLLWAFHPPTCVGIKGERGEWFRPASCRYELKLPPVAGCGLTMAVSLWPVWSTRAPWERLIRAQGGRR